MSGTPPMPLSAYHAGMLDELKRIVLAIVAPHGADVYLIGSFARGDVRQWSDIDIALDGSKIPIRDWVRLEEQVEQSTIPRRVELIDLAAVDDSFRRRVEREGVRWNA